MKKTKSLMKSLIVDAGEYWDVDTKWGNFRLSRYVLDIDDGVVYQLHRHEWVNGKSSWVLVDSIEKQEVKLIKKMIKAIGQ